MSGMYLNRTKTRAHGSARGFRKRADDRRDTILAEPAGFRRTWRERSLGRRDRFPGTSGHTVPSRFVPWSLRRGLATCVGQLDGRYCTVFSDSFGDGPQSLTVFVAPDPKICVRDAAFGYNSCSLCHHKPGATNGPADQMRRVPAVRKPIRARILAHRRDHHAVADGFASDGERIKKL